MATPKKHISRTQVERNLWKVGRRTGQKQKKQKIEGDLSEFKKYQYRKQQKSRSIADRA